MGKEVRMRKVVLLAAMLAMALAAAAPAFAQSFVNQQADQSGEVDIELTFYATRVVGLLC